jgi:hypothetical protein
VSSLSIIAGLTAWALLGQSQSAPAAPSGTAEHAPPPVAASEAPPTELPVSEVAPPPVPETVQASAVANDDGPPTAKKKKPERFHAISLQGRFDLRGIHTRAAPRQLGEPIPTPTSGIGISRAQIELGYRYRKWLSLVLQGDLAALPGLRPMYEWPAEEGPEPAEGFPLEDAYARIGEKNLAVRLGYFKPPVSGVEMASSWDLPIARRGILHSTLVEHMRFAGRRPGIQLEWARDVPLKPRLRAGVFQGSQADGSLLRTVGVYETNLAARASIEPGPVEVGFWGTVVGTPPYLGAEVGRYWVTGVDALADAPLGPFHARAWTDLAYGVSFHGLYGALGQDAPFLAGRVLLALRLGGRESASAYAELFAMAEHVNFDLTAEDRTLTGYVFGTNAGLWDRLRLTLQVEIREVGIYSPNLSAGGNPLRERTVFLAQLGGAFDERWRF